MDYHLGILSNKSLPRQQTFSLSFSSETFIVLGFTSGPWFSSTSFFLRVSGMSWGFIEFWYIDVQLFPKDLFKRLSFLHWIAFTLLLEWNRPCVCGSISGLSVLFCCFVCFFHQHGCVLIIQQLSSEWESGSVSLPTAFFS